MNLYDSLIRQVLELFQGKEMLSFPLESSFPVQKQKEFIFPDDAQVELGGKEESTYFMGYTSNPEFVNKNEILLLGKDICSLPKETPFALKSRTIANNLFISGSVSEDVGSSRTMIFAL